MRLRTRIVAATLAVVLLMMIPIGTWYCEGGQQYLAESGKIRQVVSDYYDFMIQEQAIDLSLTMVYPKNPADEGVIEHFHGEGMLPRENTLKSFRIKQISVETDSLTGNLIGYADVVLYDKSGERHEGMLILDYEDGNWFIQRYS